MRRPIAIVTMKAILLVLITLITFSVNAQKVSTSQTPGWLVKYTPDLSKKPNIKNISDGYYLLLLEEQHNEELKSVYHHYIRHIVSEAGIQNGSEISIDYDPQYEKIVFHSLVIHRDGQVINRLPSASFKQLQKEQDLSRFIYSGIYTAYHILEDVRKNDQIEYSYSIIGDNPIFNGKVDHRLYFVAFEPILNYYKNLIVSPKRNLHFKPFNNAILPTKRTENGSIIYEWNKLDVRENEQYNYLPSWYNSYNYVQVSEYNNWNEVARWALSVNGTPTPGPLLQQRINAFRQSAAGDTSLYLLLALRFVQDDIRYMGIEIGEYSHRANQPDKVLTQRFGDCKDKALLLCSMLRNYGITANLAYVSTDNKGQIKNLLPAPNAFNHVIVQVLFRGKTYWLDGTVNFQRGSLDEFCEPDYQQALVANDTTTELTPIVIRNKGSLNILETFTLPDNQYKDGSLEVVTDYNREQADIQRAEFASASMESKDESYLRYYRKLYGEVSIKDSIKVQDTVNNHNILKINESYTLNGPWKKDSTTGKLLFTLNAQSFYDALPVVSNPNRKAPVAQRYPYDLNYKIVVNTPINWTINEAPVHISNSYYKFDYIPEKGDQQITLNYHFETLSDHIPIEFIPEYVKDFKRMNEVSSMDLTWNPFLSSTSNKHTSINWLALALAPIFIMVFSWMATVYYKHSIYPSNNTEPVQIGGGLALLAIGLVFSPLMEISQFFKLPAFSYDRWIGLYAMSENINITAIQLFLIMEMIIQALLVVGSILLAVLFFNRRDTFPITLATYYFADILFIFIDQHLNNYLFKSSTDNAINNYYILFPLIKMAIWIPYIRMSDRGKSTFVIPYNKPDYN
ncbi:DUF3857 domain-containing protein [Chitinophaga silvatica]|uniref:DUF3857 domain-containing protein n=1 Tax=Chitinophaga silvatica TaxID=2282649 RepID=A0A3E1YBE5_9BACT|nr:DUF3857 domain-containing protein [Chitinophaga silvatica]RFS23330.1 DUF3857 domain-containing protein [Chitinophaga silvatica]